MLGFLRFVGLFAGSINLGLAFAHLLEMAPKRELSSLEYFTAQHIYRDFGKAAAVLLPVALVANVAAAIISRRQRIPALLTAIAAAGNAATVAIWARFNEPVNQDVVTWPERGIPSDWEQKRDRWEFAHATSALIHMVGMAALIIATLRDRR